MSRFENPSPEEHLKYILWKLGQEHARLVVKDGVMNVKDDTYGSIAWREYEMNQQAMQFIGQQLKDMGIDPFGPPPRGTFCPSCRGHHGTLSND